MTANANRILVVDDNDMQRKLVKTRLERAGFVVDAAADATEALTLARSSHPNLIVSDVLMPGVDGFELCRRLKCDASLSAIPVVLMSGMYSFRANHELAQRVGASAFLERTPSFENELASVRLCMSKLARNDFDTTSEDQAMRQTETADHARRSEQRARAMLASIQDAITVSTTDGIVIEANHRWNDILGIEPRTMIGGCIRDLVAPLHEEGDAVTYPLFDEHDSAPQIVRLRHAVTGKTVCMEVSTHLIELDGEALLVSIGRDVTDQTAHAQRLGELGQLASSVAHDLNNILAVIFSNASFLIEEQNADVRRDAEAINTAVGRATALTRQLRAAALAHLPGGDALRHLEDYPQIRRAPSHHECGDAEAF